MRTTRVRSEIAYALVRASHRQQIQSNYEDLRSFARQTLTSSRDLATQGNAIVILGLIGGEEDLALLAGVCKREEPFTFELAVAALVSIGTPHANQALEEIKRTVRSPNMASTITQMQRKDADDLTKTMDRYKGVSSANRPTDKEAVAIVVADLEKRDEAYLARRAIPNIYRYVGHATVRNLVREVWHENKRQYPTLAWDKLSQARVRVPLGQLWGQIARSIGQEAEVELVRAYVRPMLEDSDPFVRARVAECWGALGSDGDLPQLRRIALSDEREVATAAIVGIHHIGTPAAMAELKRLANEVKDEEVLLVIRRLL